MEKFRGEQKNVTRLSDFFLLYQSDFVVGLLQVFMINAHESGSNSLGAGTFSRDLTKTKSLQCRDFTWALHMEKSISPLFPGPRGDVCSIQLCAIGTSQRHYDVTLLTSLLSYMIIVMLLLIY